MLDLSNWPTNHRSIYAQILKLGLTELMLLQVQLFFDKTQITELLITLSNQLIDSHVQIFLLSSLSLHLLQPGSLDRLVDNISRTRDARGGRTADAKFLMQCSTRLASSEASEAAGESDSCCSRLKLLDSGTGGLGNPHPAPSIVVFDTFLLDPSDSVKQPIFSGGLKQTKADGFWPRPRKPPPGT